MNKLEKMNMENLICNWWIRSLEEDGQCIGCVKGYWFVGLVYPDHLHNGDIFPDRTCVAFEI